MKMKSKTIQLVAIFFLSIGTIFAQDIKESEVPSVIVNNFKKEFPKASDIEWEMHGDLYNVEFEIGWSTDYEAWFTTSGKLVKHTEEIKKSDLPKAVTNAIETDHKGYHIDDAEKIVENGVESYKIEIEKEDHDFDVFYSANGTVIKK